MAEMMTQHCPTSLPPEASAGACPCSDDALDPAAVPVVRNRYFTGKYMTARDFRDEQAYFLSRHHLHQRILHGWGIVCGLEIEDHPDIDCKEKGWVVITPGIAVDCFGREIVLAENYPVKINSLFRDSVACGDEKRNSRSDDQPIDPPLPDEDFLLGVCYGEICVEPVPLLYDDVNCGRRTAPSRIREKPCFRWRPYVKKEDCWGPAEPPVPAFPPLPASDSTQGSCAGPSHDFSRPICPCGNYGFVPLARFTFKDIMKKDVGKPTGKIELRKETSGRRYLFGPLHPYTLTHIRRINWLHGDKKTVSELVDDYVKSRKGDIEAKRADSYHHYRTDHRYMRLTVAFDRPLCTSMPLVDPPDDMHGMGFYRRLVRVRYEKACHEPHDIKVTLSHDRRKLHCDVSPPSGSSSGCGFEVVYVSINCDFLLDCQGRAVDGNHLRGALKTGEGQTGDGVEGGMFESWFQLTW